MIKWTLAACWGIRDIVQNFLSFFLFFLIVFAPFAQAGPALPGTGCDSEYWTALGARSWMEGKHDMEAAQVLITRPRSVMDVACFEGQLVRLHGAVNNLFSDNMGSTLFKNARFLPLDDYQPNIGYPPNTSRHSYSDRSGSHPSIGYAAIGPQMLDRTLVRFVRTALLTHYRNIYPATAIPAPSVSNPNSVSICGSMAGIWNTARCTNINTVNYRTFGQLQASDPRTLPTACNAQRVKWGNMVATAFPVPTLPATLGSMDDTNTFLNMLNPASCTNAGSSLPAIPTGLMVDIVGITAQGTHPDAICSAPGCWYDPGAGRCRP